MRENSSCERLCLSVTTLVSVIACCFFCPRSHAEHVTGPSASHHAQWRIENSPTAYAFNGSQFLILTASKENEEQILWSEDTSTVTQITPKPVAVKDHESIPLVLATSKHLLVGFSDGVTVRIPISMAFERGIPSRISAYLLPGVLAFGASSLSIQSIVWLRSPRRIMTVSPAETSLLQLDEFLHNANPDVEHEMSLDNPADVNVLFPNSRDWTYDKDPIYDHGDQELPEEIGSNEIMIPAMALHNLPSYPEDVHLMALNNGYVAIVRDAEDSDLRNPGVEIFDDGTSRFVVTKMLSPPHILDISSDPSLRAMFQSKEFPTFESATDDYAKIPQIDIQRVIRDGREKVSVQWIDSRNINHEFVEEACPAEF